jgi:hypothetical protein
MSDTPRTTAATLTVAILEGEPIKMVPVVVSEDMERELTYVTEQRDRLAEALRKIQRAGLVAVDAFDKLDRIDEIVDEALADVKGGSDDFDQFRPFDF